MVKMVNPYPIGEAGIPIDKTAIAISIIIALIIVLGLTGGILYLWSLV